MADDIDQEAANNNVEDGVREMYLSCPVCLDPYDNDHVPRFLPCGHTFCNKCIPTFLKDSMTCPLCKIPVYGSKDQVFPINYTVNGMIGNKEVPIPGSAAEMKKRWEDIEEGMDNMKTLVDTTTKHMETMQQKMGEYVKRCQETVDRIRGEDGQKKEVLVIMEENIRKVNSAIFDELERMKEFGKFMDEDILPTDEYFVNKNYLKRKIEPNPEDMKEYYDRLIEKYPGNDKDAQLAFAKNVRKSVVDFQSQMERYFPKVNFSSRAPTLFPNRTDEEGGTARTRRSAIHVTRHNPGHYLLRVGDPGTPVTGPPHPDVDRALTNALQAAQDRQFAIWGIPIHRPPPPDATNPAASPAPAGHPTYWPFFPPSLHFPNGRTEHTYDSLFRPVHPNYVARQPPPSTNGDSAT